MYIEEPRKFSKTVLKNYKGNRNSGNYNKASNAFREYLLENCRNKMNNIDKKYSMK